jgi:hypothetical protein
MHPDEPNEPNEPALPQADEELEEADQRLILEIVERANDRFQARLDALDTLLVGLLAATLAICGLVIDRISDLGQGLWFLGAAYCSCGAGLIVGNLIKRPRDAPDPVKAIVGINDDPQTALQGLADDIAQNWRDSQWLRRWKIWAAVAALALLTAGTIAATHEKVVNWNREAPQSRGNRSDAPTPHRSHGSDKTASREVRHPG